MSSEDVSKGRRNFLTATTSVVGGVGMLAAAVPFIKSWQPSARAEAAGAPVEADVSKLEENQKLTIEWRGKPVFVVRRSDESLKLLDSVKDNLRDPASDNLDMQPDYARNEFRSIKPEYMVLVAICTHLGCVPEYVPQIGAQPFDENWAGGFYCPCHKSKFDMAGRVYSGVPAPANLEVPPYHFPADGMILIGLSAEEAA